MYVWELVDIPKPQSQRTKDVIVSVKCHTELCVLLYHFYNTLHMEWALVDIGTVVNQSIASALRQYLLKRFH